MEVAEPDLLEFPVKLAEEGHLTSFQWIFFVASVFSTVACLN